MKLPDLWRTILEGAVRSPSPHNTQPWRVRVIDDQRAELYLDRSRLLPDEDLTSCFQVSAAGIFIEAVSLLAAGQGRRVEVAYHVLELALPMIRVADLTLVEGESISGLSKDAERLGARRTSRLPHTGERIVSDEVAGLHRLAEAHGQKFGVTTESGLIDRILARNTQAVFEDMNVRPYHDEFVGWLRTPSQAAETRDGLELSCMRMSVAEYRLLRHASWVLRVPGLSGALAKRYRGTLGQTDQIGWLSGPFWDHTKAIEAGRFLLRFWLAMDGLGMGMHPLGNLVTNASANAWVSQELVKGPGVWMVFRFGRTAEPPASCRRSVEEVLLD